MSDQPPLIAAPRKRGKLYAIIAGSVVIAIAIVFAAVAIGSSSGTANNASGAGNAITEGKGSAGDPVRIGVVGASDPYWEVYTAAAADEGISVDIVDFTDYTQPNAALTEGDLDLNQFQTVIYLAQYNEAAQQDVAPIGATAIYPLSLYSTEYTTVKDITEGETVAVPNDPANLARALLVLQSAELVELKDGGSPLSTLDDVLPSSKVEVTALEAALTPTSLPDVAAAIINNDFVDDAGLTVDEALFSDDAADPAAAPYINIFAARAADKDNKVYSKLVTIFQTTKAVTDGVIEVSGGSAVIAATPVADLVASLKKAQASVAAE